MYPGPTAGLTGWGTVVAHGALAVSGSAWHPGRHGARGQAEPGVGHAGASACQLTGNLGHGPAAADPAPAAPAEEPADPTSTVIVHRHGPRWGRVQVRPRGGQIRSGRRSFSAKPSRRV